MVTAIVLALQAVIYTYDGWTGPLYFGEEVKDPGRGIPRAMAFGVLLVILIYVLAERGLRPGGRHRADGGRSVRGATAGQVLFGERGDLIIRSLVLLSILSGMNACLLMAPRVVLAMSRDRLLPRGFESVNPGGTPTVGHWSSVGVALAFIISGTFNTVLAVCAFFFVASYTLSFLSVFALRRKEPDTPRPYRVPGYPYTTGLVLLASIAFLVGSVITDWGNSWKSSCCWCSAIRCTGSSSPTGALPDHAIHPSHRSAAGGHLRRRDHHVEPAVPRTCRSPSSSTRRTASRCSAWGSL